MGDSPGWGLDGTLALARPHLDAALVSDAAWRALLDIAGHVPATLADVAYRECRLARGAPRVDLIIRLGPLGLAHSPDWTTMRALTPAANSLWLEFDANRADPMPLVFVGFDERRLDPPPEVTSLLTAIVRHLARRPLHPNLINAISRVVGAFPRSSTVPYVGYLDARDPPVARLYFRGISPDGLARCLGEAGWLGPQARLTSLVTSIGVTGVAIGMVHVDIAQDGSVPRVGIEYTFDRPCQRRRVIAEQAFLEWLVDGALCTAEKRSGLDGFPGISVGTAPHELWPSRIERRLNCIKLAVDAGGHLEAKAYCRQALFPIMSA
jgi:hypothetical protein